eukprot:11554098-Ditylum_brightwellii.AAC.1
MSQNKNEAAQDTILPVTSLQWDKDNNAFKEALEMAEATETEEGPGWKRAGKEKGQKWAKKGKMTGLVTIDMLDHNKKQRVKEKIQETGERAMDNKTVFQTN